MDKFLLKTKYDTDKLDLEKKRDISTIVKKPTKLPKLMK